MQTSPIPLIRITHVPPEGVLTSSVIMYTPTWATYFNQPERVAHMFFTLVK